MTETSYWRPFAQMGAVKESPLVIVSGEGRTVWDADGKAYPDSLAGLWYCNVALGRRELAAVAAEQLNKPAALHSFDL